ncbi:MarR family winged helix-turn-helix transcriptional regulator [Embleya sp. AB8]|uniref:MarR family winged helix-turn-helix transcriptional regulator n=1 Tax=Embleya sp. AB8 TaxID=3156304 RepID=UPI003C73B68E
MSDKLVIRQHAVKSDERACDAYSALIDQIVRLADVVEAVGNGIARPTGQSLARWQVLAAVEHEAAPVGDIAGRLGHTRQSVQRVADLLVDDELGCYRPNPAHQRAKLLEVTPVGRAALHRMQAAYTHLALRTTEGLDPERLDLARETLSELQRRLESELP